MRSWAAKKRAACRAQNANRLSALLQQKAPMRLKYSAEELEFLRAGYQSMPVKKLVNAFNACFGTDKSESQIRSTLKNHGVTSGRTGRFEKGVTSWNKGRRGYMGANVTSFKKGSVPPNRKTLGAERICSKDGFVLVKVAETDPYTGFPTRYKHKHVHVWEQHHGSVPEGLVVAFRDGDKLNCDITNLMLITRAELLRLNQYRYRQQPLVIKPTVLALSKVEVKMFGRMRGQDEAVEAVDGVDQ